MPPAGWKLFLLLVTHFIAFPSSGTHIVGGEIYYTWMGNNTYEITLKVYRDCGPANVNGTGFDPIASVGIYRSNGQLHTSLPMDLFQENIQLVPIELENPCFVLPPDVCVESATYIEIIQLPPVPGGYNLSYQRCCRNPSIINIDFPQNSGATFTCHIPGTNETNEPNSSPVFVNFPPPALCANAEFFFDHQAIDPDGDELVYEFCSPLLGGTPDMPAPTPATPPPYTSVDWATGFSSFYPISSNPAFSIDEETGFITGTANQPGQYVVGVCVSEYRNGVLINRVNRDFQVNVTICDPNIVASVPDQTSLCDGLNVQFENTSVNATTFLWDFGVENLTTDTSSLSTPFYSFPDTGNYTITLIANPGWSCADTATTVYSIFPVIQPQIIVGGSECVNDQVLYQFSFQGNASPSALVNWNFGPGSIPQTSQEWFPEGILLNPEDASHTVSLNILDSGCEESATETLANPPEPEAIIDPQESFCDGLTETFTHSSEFAQNYWWDFGTALNGDQSMMESPVFTFPDTGSYVVTLVASAPFTCPDTTQALYTIYGNLSPFFEVPDPQCLSTNSFSFFALGASTAGAEYAWTFGGPASSPSSDIRDPEGISWNEAGTYPVTLTITENGCTATFEAEVSAIADPTLDVDLDPQAGCPDLYASFQAQAFAETPVFFTWDFGDGGTSTLQSPMHVYTQSGVYDVTVTAYTTNGCVASLSAAFPQAVTVHPEPVAGFTLSPQTISILDPTVEVNDASVGGISCFYTMSDGGQSDDCSFTYSWTQAGRQSITQFVVNEFGCTDRISGIVNVEGFLLWAPNAFSPDGDGINDVWRPVTTGVSQYHLEIRDRWGVLLFETNRPEEPWLGQVQGGTHYAADGVYVYTIRLEDLLGFPRDYSGHISLVR